MNTAGLRTLLCIGAFAGGCITSPVSAPALLLARDGRVTAAIVVAEDASLPVRHAADELQQFLSEVTGARFPLLHRQQEGGVNILVGPGAVRQADPEFQAELLGVEGILIRTAENDLILADGDPRGTLYAVYYIPGGNSRLPLVHAAGERHSPRLDITYHPSFEYRETFYSPAFDADWAVRNKCNAHHHKLDKKRGRKVVCGRWGHTFPELIRDDEYLEDHPEYFSLIDGMRVSSSNSSGQICLTNPDVLKIVTEKVLAWIREIPEARIWSVSQNDNDLWLLPM